MMPFLTHIFNGRNAIQPSFIKTEGEDDDKARETSG